MTKFSLLTATLLCFLACINTAQAQKCGSTLAAQQQQAQNPSFRRDLAQAQKLADEWRAKHPNGDETRVIVTVPVVVHVVYQNATQNISNAQVQTQIDVLNRDYGRTNTDASNTPAAFASLCGDAQIRFCLATTDPNGNSTTGILHVPATGSYSGNANFGTTNDEKSASTGGSTIWDRNKYLNIWVCNLGNNLLGYTYQPGVAASIDGVVIGYQYFGTIGTATAPYNLGRTATHEVGHWFNLDHIWGDEPNCSGSDNVADTPNQAGENYGCVPFPHTDACAPNSPGVMFMNYMDYVDDNCMNMFTLGQGTRMQAAVNGPRASLKTSNGCSGGGSQTLDAGITTVITPNSTTCSSTFQPQATLLNSGTIALTSATISYTITSGPSGSYNWTGNLNAGASVTVTLPSATVTAGAHTITITVASPNGGTDANAGNNSTVKNFTVAGGNGVAAPFAEGFQGIFPNTAAGWVLNNPNADAYQWATYASAGQGGTSKSVFIDNFNNTVKGTIDEFILPAINTMGLNGPKVTFWVAHKYYPYYNSNTNPPTYWIDTLQALYSINCGVSYVSLGKLSRNQLVNNPTTDTLGQTAFVPTSESNWKGFFATLPNDPSIIIKFRNIAQYGQNIYIDNINILGNAVGIEDVIAEEAFSVYPNPASGLFTAKYEATKRGEVQIQVLDLTGKEITHLNSVAQEGANEFMIPISDFAAGYYLVRLTVGDKTAIRKLIVE